jgi:hypothetical protein
MIEALTPRINSNLITQQNRAKKIEKQYRVVSADNEQPHPVNQQLLEETTLCVTD